MGIEATIREQFNSKAVLLLQEDHACPIVACCIGVRFGATSTLKTDDGMAHLIEHVVTQSRWQRHVSELGGEVNGFTWYDWTLYQSILPSKYARLSIDMFFDFLSEPNPIKENLNSILSRIKKEIRARRSNPKFLQLEKFINFVFKDQLYEHSILGKEELINTVTSEKMIRYLQTFYCWENIVITLVGDFSPHEIISACKKRVSEPLFSSIKITTPNHIRKEDIRTQIDKIEINNDRNLPSQSLLIGYRIPGFRSTYRYAFEITGELLSLLLEQRKNNCITVTTIGLQNPDVLLFREEEISLDKLSQSINLIIQQIKRLSAGQIKKTEIEGAVNRRGITFLLAREDFRSRARCLTIAELKGNYNYERHYLHQISAITLEQIANITQKFLAAEPYVMYITPTRNYKTEIDNIKCDILAILSSKNN